MMVSLLKGILRTRVVSWRNAGVALLLLSFVSMQAQAVCPNCPLSPLITAQKTAFTGAMAASAQAIIAAVGLMGGGTASAKQAQVAAAQDAAKSKAEHHTYVAMRETYHNVRANQTVNMQSVNCRLQTINNTIAVVKEKFEGAVAFNLQDGVINLFFNHNFSPARTRVATIQRNCKNGQLLRTDMGSAWWDAINAASPATSQCFEDTTDVDGDGQPDFAHAFMKATTVLDHRVMVAPSSADMTVLNNPDGGGNPQTVWNGLTVKQKLYVSAVRFCENLALYALQPLGVSGDAAMAAENQATILQNLAAIGKLDALVYACRSELARRTAPDAAAMVAAGYTDMQPVVDNAAKVAELLLRTGAQKRSSGEADEFQEIIGGTTVSYVSPALLAYARSEAFCNNNETMKSIYSDTGTDSKKTDNVVQCELLKMTNLETEQIYRSLFNDMIGGIGKLAPQFSDKLPTPTRAEGRSMIQQAGLRQPTPQKLIDMLR